MQRRSLIEAREEAKQHAHEHRERDWFQRPRTPDNPNRSGGWDAKPEWSGASWGGERWSGANWGGGRDR